MFILETMNILSRDERSSRIAVAFDAAGYICEDGLLLSNGAGFRHRRRAITGG